MMMMTAAAAAATWICERMNDGSFIGQPNLLMVIYLVWVQPALFVRISTTLPTSTIHTHTHLVFTKFVNTVTRTHS